jgi:hypothetical protein
MAGNSINIGYPKLVTDLVTEPVSLTDFKSYAHITYTDDDTVLTAIVKSARIFLEKYSGKSFGEKVFEIVFSTSGRGINLPNGYVESLDVIEYREEWCCGSAPDWTDITADTDEWSLVGDRFFGGEGEYQITYTTNGDALTEDIKTAIKAQAKYMWDNKDSDTISPIAKMLVSGLISGDRML